jgi:hypothetical protein
MPTRTSAFALKRHSRADDADDARADGSLGVVAADRIFVLEAGREISFSFEDMLRYHGGGSPGGVAHAFKVLERALPLLDAGGGIERRELVIETAFGGPGARDAFELVTRAVTGERFALVPAMMRPALGRARERFVFRLRRRDRAVTLILRPGFVTDQFVDLTSRDLRSADDEHELAAMKSDMAARVMSAAAAAVYDVLPDQRTRNLQVS